MQKARYPCNVSKSCLILFSLLLVVFIGFVRYITGHELALSLFYLLPITLVAWNTGRWPSIFISFASALSWLIVDLTFIDQFSTIIIPFVNEAFRLIVFLLVANITYKLKNALETHKKLARTDSLTEISNRLGFMELATMEVNKAKRYKSAISMLYMDIDNFKGVNDSFGHQKGDDLLCDVAKTIEEHTRIIDVIARLGGDEFVVLISQTNAKASFSVAKKLSKQLLLCVEKKGYPVTFSMGLVTYEYAPCSVNEMLKTADKLMYDAKKNGKNRIRRATIDVTSIKN